ncbi:hypothetical protein JMN32_21150 [Fulvivirga sp. 29W222]|uniref:DUF4377 domain-containing protein n=1 Tax=Fulvivirga marina TaxID=2494733 RepID=A0A937KG51_9BACT|nr:hypothetical protein [Fulvivirga marina]MBL6448833.1 hypothetical protein [Fulvivirga marina]
MNRTFSLLLVVLLMIFWACDTDTIEPDEERLGTTFFPLSVGSYSIYEVENIDYKITGEVITSHFQRKVAVVDSFENQAGTISYIVHYSQRDTEADPWEFSTAWTARKDGNQVVLIEDNIPYIKISFPIETGKTWNGNALNSLDSIEYKMDSLYSEYITPAQDTIENTLTVIQENDEDFVVDLNRKYEIYGLNIGLVYKEDVFLQFCTDTDCLGQQQIEVGHEYRQYLTVYGSE